MTWPAWYVGVGLAWAATDPASDRPLRWPLWTGVTLWAAWWAGGAEDGIKRYWNPYTKRWQTESYLTKPGCYVVEDVIPRSRPLIRSFPRRAWLFASVAVLLLAIPATADALLSL